MTNPTSDDATPNLSRRLQLVALAVSMESIFALLAFLSLAPIVLLTAMFYSTNFAIGAGIALFAGCWYLLQPDFALTDWHQELENSSPVWQTVRELCTALDAPLPHRVVVCDELNAFAHTHGGALALIGVRRTLGLGIPALMLLSASELRGVIAHELGHFSRHHDRLGHWIYRVRCKWQAFAFAAPGETGVIDGAIAAIAERVLPLFFARSAQWSMRCEFEADAAAARAQTGRSLATALLKLKAVDVAWKDELARRLRREQLRSPEAPRDFWHWVVEAAREVPTPVVLNAAESERRRVLGVHRITHPPLSARLQALGVDQGIQPDWTTPCAGDVLLGDKWPTMVAEFSERTRSQMHPAWRMEHYRLVWSQAVLEGASTDRTVSPDLQLQHLVAAERLHRDEQTLAALEQAAVGHDTEAAFKFAYGAALLERDQEIGKAILRDSYQLDRTFAPVATRLVASHDQQFASFDHARQSLATAQAAWEWEQRFTSDFRDRLFQQPLAALPDDFVGFARAALRQEDRLDACWAVRFPSRTIKARTFSISVFVFRVVPDSAADVAPLVDEDELVDEYLRLLAVALPANELVRFVTFYTTEPIDPKLMSRLEGCPGSTIVAPRLPMIVDMIRFDQG